MTPIEEAIVEKLREIGPCCLDDVVTSLPNSSWGVIFAAVDRMSRDGRLLLHQSRYSAYQVSLGSHVAYPVQRLVAEGKGASQSLER
ncbi:MAG TPA: hypothetical protein VK901_18515 [Nitrospiraceae bacterium]|nr:hypothetical protein [Nitrospiraceae bacterium]